MRKTASEAMDRRKVVGALKSLHAFAVENLVYPGTPDIAFIGGWIEMKKLDEWPVRKTTKVRISHYTKEQRGWAKIHHRRGGKSYWLLRVRQDWVLLHAHLAAELVGTVTKTELIEGSLLYMHNGFDSDQLLRTLKELTNEGRHAGES